MKRTILSTLLAGTVLVAPGFAQAYHVYDGQDPNGSATTPLSSYPLSGAAEAAFKSQLTGVGTETFEGLAPGPSASVTLSFPGAVSATLTGGGQVCELTPPPGLCAQNTGRYSISPGSKFYAVASSTFVVEFSEEIAAFGFYGIDLGDAGGELFLDFRDSGMQLIESKLVPMASQADGSVVYFGVIAENNAELFKYVSFRAINTTTATDNFAFDNFTIGTAAQAGIVPEQEVPEPGSLALVGLALASLGLTRRKRN